MKHTAGPWHTKLSHSDGDDLISVDALDKHITLHMIEADEDIANANLVALAPELLETLKKAYDCIKARMVDLSEWAECDQAYMIQTEIEIRSMSEKAEKI